MPRPRPPVKPHGAVSRGRFFPRRRHRRRLKDQAKELVDGVGQLKRRERARSVDGSALPGAHLTVDGRRPFDGITVRHAVSAGRDEYCADGFHDDLWLIERNAVARGRRDDSTRPHRQLQVFLLKAVQDLCDP
jgi:hypothetical protein